MPPPPVLFSAEQIARRVDELAERISADYADKGELVLVGVLKGSYIFLADLSRRISVPRRVEFLAVSSYGRGSVSSGAVRLDMDLREAVAGRHLLIVEDIVDSGRTLRYLIDMLRSRGPASVRTCSLLYKAELEVKDLVIDYAGFEIEDKWVVGYGLDYAERDRALPYIGTITPDDRA